MACQWHKCISGCESSPSPLQELGHHGCLLPTRSLSVPLPHPNRRLSHFRSFHLINCFSAHRPTQLPTHFHRATTTTVHDVCDRPRESRKNTAHAGCNDNCNLQLSVPANKGGNGRTVDDSEDVTAVELSLQECGISMYRF